MPIPQLQHHNLIDTLGKVQGVKNARTIDEIRRQDLSWAREDRPVQQATARAEVARAAAKEARDVETHDMDMLTKQFDYGKKLVTLARDQLPAVSPQTYGDYIDWAQNTLGIDMSTAPPVEEVQRMTPEQFEQVKTNMMMTAEDAVKMDFEEFKRKKYGQPYTDESGNVYQKEETTGKIDRLAAAPRGMEVTTADGTTIRTGITPGTMQRKTKGDIEEKALGAAEGLSRLSDIVGSFKPEFLQIPTKAGVAWDSLKAKMGKDLDPEERQALEDYAAFQQDALSNINLYIKEITGAQMSEKEANRIRKAMPDPGEGIFDGDDPYEFKRKLTNQMKKFRSAIARYNYYLKEGINDETVQRMVNQGKVISLEEMDRVINERFADLQKKNPDKGMDELLIEVQRDFGLVK